MSATSMKVAVFVGFLGFVAFILVEQGVITLRPRNIDAVRPILAMADDVRSIRAAIATYRNATGAEPRGIDDLLIHRSTSPETKRLLVRYGDRIRWIANDDDILELSTGEMGSEWIVLRRNGWVEFESARHRRSMPSTHRD